MVHPVARLALDSRSWGPAYCEKCDADLEDVILMSDATVVCEECGTPVKGFEEVFGVFTAAEPLRKEWTPKKR